ncbi:low affinity iron permease family protein [Acidobacteria bacterium AB60]|nr:low affinity iron permease family protein [Acidobacteria bacterium AB60]
MRATRSEAQGSRSDRRERERAVAEAVRGTSDPFGRLATKASAWLGSRFAFLGALVIILGWGASGPFFHFSDTWQLVINTGTTIVTFLMVFLIQNTQNRDSKAINLKLDELIHANAAAANQMMDIESLSDEELSVIQKRYEAIRAECIKREKRRRVKVG